jgi:hypothetical protein
MVLLSLYGCKEEGVIEEDAMAQIYAEMLLTDQWINSTPGVRTIADTSLVYEPILKKYGYSSAEYRRSVDYYLNDPKKYADIMKETVKILDARLAALNQKKALIEEEKTRKQYVKNVTRDLKISDSWQAMRHLEEQQFGVDDSLSVAWDSIAYCFSIVMLPKEAINDTIKVQDSIKVQEKLYGFQTFKKPDVLRLSDTLFIR